MRITIRGRLLGGFLLVVLLLGVVAFVGANGLNQATTKYADLSGRVKGVIIRSQQIEGSILDEARAVSSYLVTRDPQYIQDFNAAAKEVASDLEIQRAGTKTAEGQALLKQVIESTASFEELARGVFSRTDLTPEEASYILTNQLQPILTKAITASDGMLELGDRLSAQFTTQAEAAAKSARTASLVVGTAAALIGILIALWLSQLISRPVLEVVAVATSLAQGDLRVPELVVRTKDEIGDMATAVNQMVKHLRDLVTGVTETSRTLMASSEELAATSEQSAQASETAASAATQVSASATEQSAAAVEVHRVMEELQQTIHQIATGSQTSAAEVARASDLLSRVARAMDDVASSAGAVASQAGEAAKTAQTGAVVVQQSVEGMKRIEAAVAESASKIRSLEQYSAQIGEITEVINGIAEQTNLLALNAAIEAARAGEHGRGFAVVAEEVRRLAERSATATREISGLIANIQVGTSEAVHAMESGTLEVEKGSRLAVDAGAALQQILTVVLHATSGVQEISRTTQGVRSDTTEVVQVFQAVAAVTEENTAATQEMAASTAQVMKAMDRVTQTATRNADAAEDVSSTVEELTASAEEVASAANSLTQVAEGLQAQVSQFRI